MPKKTPTIYLPRTFELEQVGKAMYEARVALQNVVETLPKIAANGCDDPRLPMVLKMAERALELIVYRPMDDDEDEN